MHPGRYEKQRTVTQCKGGKNAIIVDGITELPGGFTGKQYSLK